MPAVISHGLGRSHTAKYALDHLDGAGLALRVMVGEAGWEHPPLHGAVLAQLASERAGVDAGDQRNVRLAQPFRERAPGEVVAVVRCVMLHHHPLHLGAAGLKPGTGKGLARLGGHAVVAHERIGEDQNLPRIRGVGEGLGGA